MIVREWGAAWGIPMAALVDLEQRMGLAGLTAATVQHGDEPGHSEAYAQSQIRLEAPAKGCWLGRNNVGALLDQRGVPVRYGLANESAKMNKRIKSSDLIGLRRRLIVQADVGNIIGQFVAREIKAPGWSFGGSEHELAQLKFGEMVIAHGGDFAFATGPGTL